MILRLKNGEYINAESFGFYTWGTDSQTRVEKKRKKWYVVTSYCVNKELDIWERDETALDVIAELDTLPEGCVLANQDDYDCLQSMLSKSGKN